MNKVKHKNLKRSFLVTLLCVVLSNADSQEKVPAILKALTANNDYPRDLVVDSEGNTHVVFVHSPVEGIDTTSEHQLIYAKFFRDRSSVQKKVFSLTPLMASAAIVLNTNNEASIFYSIFWQSGFVRFDRQGTLQVGPKVLYSDSRIRVCTRSDEYVYAFMDGGYKTLIDPRGNIISSVGTLNRPGTGLHFGYSVQIISEKFFLVIWPARVYATLETQRPFDYKKEGYIGYVVIDDSLNHLFVHKEAKITDIAEAEYVDILLSEIVMIRVNEQVIAYIPERKATDEIVLYKVRFNSKGEPIRDGRMIRTFPKSIKLLSMAKRQIRFDVVKDKNEQPTEGSYLYGFTVDGEIAYETNSVLLKSRGYQR